MDMVSSLNSSHALFPVFFFISTDYGCSTYMATDKIQYKLYKVSDRKIMSSRKGTDKKISRD